PGRFLRVAAATPLRGRLHNVNLPFILAPARTRCSVPCLPRCWSRRPCRRLRGPEKSASLSWWGCAPLPRWPAGRQSPRLSVNETSQCAPRLVPGLLSRFSLRSSLNVDCFGFGRTARDHLEFRAARPPKETI